MLYDKNSFLQGIALGRAMKGVDVVGGSGTGVFWSGENLLTEAQRNFNNWNRILFQSYENAYSDGVNDMTITPDGIHDRLWISETIEPYTTYVFTGLYRSISGSNIVESYEPDFSGERNAVLSLQPSTQQLHTYNPISLSPALYVQPSEEFRRYSAFAYANTTTTIYLCVNFGKYQDFRSTHVQWKDMCFAKL